MTTGIPFSSTHLHIDLDTVQEMAAQRALPLVPQQPRDNQGQFQSHKDVPGSQQLGSQTVREPIVQERAVAGGEYR